MAQRSNRPHPADGTLSSVTNAILLMKAFSDEQAELGISELAERLELPKSTVHRLATKLVEVGMLEQHEASGKYRLGIVLFELGSLVRRKMDVSLEAKPLMIELRRQTGETVNLSILDQDSVMCVHFLESTSLIRVGSGIGMRKPTYCTAEGKALIAFQQPRTIQRIIAAGLEKRTRQTITDPTALTTELAAVRSRGYAIDDEEYENGVRGIAAPVRDETHYALAAVGITGPADRLTRAQTAELGRLVMATAEEISARLGAPRP